MGYKHALAAFVAVTALGAAQAQDKPADKADDVDVSMMMYTHLVEQFALVQAKSTPEVKANPGNPQALATAFRNVFVGIAADQQAKEQQLTASVKNIMKHGFKTRDECIAASFENEAYRKDDALLWIYDYLVDAKEYPGPKLRSDAVVERSRSSALTHHVAVGMACANLKPAQP